MFLSRCFTTVWCIYVDVFKMHWKILWALSLWSRPGLLPIIQKKITYSVKLWRGCWKFTASLTWCINVAWACTSCQTKRERVSSPYCGMQLQECHPLPSFGYLPKENKEVASMKAVLFLLPAAWSITVKESSKAFRGWLGSALLYISIRCDGTQTMKGNDCFMESNLLEKMLKRHNDFWSNLGGRQEGELCQISWF